MEPTYKNEQDFLAFQFQIMDLKLNKWSHEAVLAIRRLNFISRIPLIDQTIRQDTENQLKANLFCYVPSSMILLGEGYFSSHIQN